MTDIMSIMLKLEDISYDEEISLEELELNLVEQELITVNI